jgi:hypothetical protein
MNYAYGTLLGIGTTVRVEIARITYTRVFYAGEDLCCEARIEDSPLRCIGTWLPSEGRWEWLFVNPASKENI